MLVRVAQRSSAVLAAVATLALVVTPLVHAEQHVHEADLGQSLGETVQAHWHHHHDDAEHDDAEHEGDEHVADATGAHGDDDAGSPAEEEHHRHGHSHGAGQHGTNSLQHLGVALLAAAAVAILPRQPPPSVRLPPEHVQRHLIPDYLAPDRAQGPPRLGRS